MTTRAPTREEKGGQCPGAALLVTRRNSKWWQWWWVGQHFSTRPWAALPLVGALVMTERMLSKE